MSEKKEILICLHGFGKKRTEELNWIQETLGNDIEIVMPNLFDPTDSNDDDATIWYNRASLFVEDYILRGYEVNLLGFSMGGVMACACCTYLEIKRCILLAPAFDLVNIKNVNNMITTLTKKESFDETANFNNLPSTFYSTLFDVVLRYRESAKHITTPTLMIQGMQDSIVSYHAARRYFSMFPSERKQLILLEKGHHVLTEDEGVKQEVSELIRLFIHDKIVK